MVNSIVNNEAALVVIKELFLEVRNNDFRYNVVEQIFLFMSYNEINFDTISVFIPIETFVYDLSSLDKRLFTAIKKVDLWTNKNFKSSYIILSSARQRPRCRRRF